MSFFVPFYATFYISEKEKYISIYKSGHDKWSDVKSQGPVFCGKYQASWYKIHGHKWSAFVVRKMANSLIYRFFQVLSLNLTLSDRIIILDKLYK